MTETGNQAAELTLDAIFNGGLTLSQPRTGYRFSVDALLLADFARVNPGQLVVDLGTGVGVIALALARRMGRGRVLAVEVQARLADCARKNVSANPSPVDIRVLEMDWSDLGMNEVDRPVDVVVCNPPYRRLGAGRLNPDAEEAVARHEIKGGLASAARTAKRLLVKGGSLFVIYPASRLAGSFARLTDSSFEPKRLRMIHSRAGEEARLALIEARSGGGEELTVEPPLIIYRGKNDYTVEVKEILSGKRFDGIKGPTIAL
jgi:tRNA1Val (adenine37-N6)-methyltransferase